MGIKIETWSIAYRIKQDGLIINDCSGFKIIKNGYKGWYADPFVFDKDGDTYLFAEFYSYSLRRGVLVCALYDEKSDSFGEFKEIIREEYHLSYPFVFQSQDGNIFLLPESNESKQLYLYKADFFPYKWKKYKILKNNIQLVDTTPFTYQNKLYAFSLEISDQSENTEQFILLEIDSNNWVINNEWKIKADMSIDRPGGRVFQINGENIFVSQDCHDSYGRALKFSSFQIKENGKIDRSVFKTILPEDFSGDFKKEPSGVHTYNFGKRIEVIDLKYFRNSYYRVLKKLLKRK